MSTFTFAPLAPAADCDGVPALTGTCPPLHEVVGVGPGNLLGGGGLDRVAAHLNALGATVPDPMWPAAVVASFFVGVVALLLAGLVGYAIGQSRSTR